MSELELDVLLFQIARGEVRVSRFVGRRSGQPVEVMIGPDISERIAAIDKLYKRFRSYTQDKPNPEQGNPYAGWTNEQMEAELRINEDLLID